MKLILSLTFLAFVLAATPSVAAPQGIGGGPWEGDNGSGLGPWSGPNGNGGSSSNSASSGAGNGLGGFDYATLTIFEKKNRVIIAHAVLACLAWVLFIPFGAILLRLNLKSPVILKLHTAIQIFSYLIFVAAVGMGIWLARQIEGYTNVWSNPHTIIGLVIFALVFFQPFLGYFHHRIYKQRSTKTAAGHGGPTPGRTWLSRAHVWLGRGLITLAITNGGLGLRLSSASPNQSADATRTGEIAYGVIAGLLWLLYIGITLVWEDRRAAAMSRRRRESQIAMGNMGIQGGGRNKDELPPYSQRAQAG